MSDPTFAAIRLLLAPYAKHFTVWEDSDDIYDLEEETPGARTLFGSVYRTRRGVQLLLYPLNVFPELHEKLPRTLASKLTQKYVLRFSTLAAAERAALAKLVTAAWQRVAAQRVLNPGRSYHRRLDLQQTFDAVQRLLAKSSRATATLHKHHVTIQLATGVRTPRALVAKQTRPGALRLTTITPAEHDALGRLATRR